MLHKMEPPHNPPTTTVAAPVALPRKIPIGMSPSVQATLAAAGVLSQRRGVVGPINNAPLNRRPPSPAAPPIKVRRLQRTPSSSSTSFSDDSESSDSESSNREVSSSSLSSSSEDDAHDDGQSTASTNSQGSTVERTFLDIARAQGWVNKDVLSQELQDAPASAPPRPPVIRSFPTDIDKALERYCDRLNREENMIQIKDDNKAVSLGTSKINYIDPRIVCSWAKSQDVPISRIFSATIMKKFPWAMSAENFEF